MASFSPPAPIASASEQTAGDVAPTGGLTELERRLLDEYQRDLPLVPAPFASIAARLGTDEAEVLRLLASLVECGIVS